MGQSSFSYFDKHLIYFKNTNLKNRQEVFDIDTCNKKTINLKVSPEELKTIKELVIKEQKRNPHNKKIQNIELSNHPDLKERYDITDENVQYAREIHEMFSDVGVFHSKINEKPSRDEIKFAKEIIDKVEKIENLKNDFYYLSKNEYNNYKKYKTRIDTFCINVYDVMTDIGKILNNCKK